jgi:hypothetical protein
MRYLLALILAPIVVAVVALAGVVLNWPDPVYLHPAVTPVEIRETLDKTRHHQPFPFLGRAKVEANIQTHKQILKKLETITLAEAEREFGLAEVEFLKGYQRDRINALEKWLAENK